MVSLFTTEDKLTDFCLEGGDWYNIIRNQQTIYICNGSDDEEWDTSNEVLKVLHRSGVGIEVDNGLAKDIESSRDAVTDLVNPIYILDYSSSDALKISEKYGVIFLPTQDTPKPVIARRGWDVDTSDKNFDCAWKSFLDGIVSPANSIVIVDRYLFSSQEEESFEDSVNNIRNILNALLPSHHVKDFTVSIIFDLSKSDEELSTIAMAVNKIRKVLVGKTEFNLELYSITSDCYKYEDTHDRFIVSNYYIINATHKLKAFSTDGNSFCNQKLYFDYIFSKGIEEGDRSTIPVVTQDRIIKAICEAISTSKNEIDYALNGQTHRKGDFKRKSQLFCL